MRPVSPAPVYAAIIPRLSEVARAAGYALGVHGSMAKDLDLLAVPWEAGAVSAEELVERLAADAKGLGARLVPSPVHQPRPHGRLAWTIQFGHGLYVDVSVMPRGEVR